ncbi:MAG TPA: ATP-binding cassette domain-containing protein [Bauldia sp.]|nr:ATP-binding cassette domain-containing protein [Bauldia sp.]
MTTILELRNLHKAFELGPAERLIAVRDVSLELGRGETLALVGESGSGKTTIGRCALRMVEPTSGAIVFAGQDITTLAAAPLRALRARMQMVFQDPFASLNPRFRVGDIVADPLRVHTSLRRDGRMGRVAEILRDVGLAPDVARYFPADLTARAEILSLLQGLQAATDVSYIFISHDLISVAKISHRIAVLYLGSLVELAPTETVMTAQRHPYSQALLAAVLFPDPSRKPAATVIEGEIPSAINPREECAVYGRCPMRIDACLAGRPPLRAVAPAHEVACLRAEETRGRADDAALRQKAG